MRENLSPELNRQKMEEERESRQMSKDSIIVLPIHVNVLQTQRQGTSDDQFCVMVTDKPVIYAVAYIPRISDPASETNARGGGESRRSPRSKPDKLT